MTVMLVALGVGATIPPTAVLAWLLRELLSPKGRLVTRRQMDELLGQEARSTAASEERARLADERIERTNERLTVLLGQLGGDRVRR